MLRYAIATGVSVAAPLGAALLYSALLAYRASLEPAPTAHCRNDIEPLRRTSWDRRSKR